MFDFNGDLLEKIDYTASVYEDNSSTYTIAFFGPVTNVTFKSAVMESEYELYDIASELSNTRKVTLPL